VQRVTAPSGVEPQIAGPARPAADHLVPRQGAGPFALGDRVERVLEQDPGDRRRARQRDRAEHTLRLVGERQHGAGRQQ
jgi:hypothetical protein